MTPLMRQDVRQRAGMDTRVAAGGTLIRRYALALTPAGAGIEAAVAAASVPPLGGGPDGHGSAAAHPFPHGRQRHSVTRDMLAPHSPVLSPARRAPGRAAVPAKTRCRSRGR